MTTGLPWYWLAFGFGAQALFMARMVVQWLASERHRRSVVPVAFWWISLVGGASLLVYFLRRGDPVGIFGQATGVFIYSRNLVFIYGTPTSREEGRDGDPPRPRRSRWRLVAGAGLALVLAAFLVGGLVLVALRSVGRGPLPPSVGNFPDRLAAIEAARPGAGSFSFAVLGDVRGYGTAAAPMDRLRGDDLAFAVLLGDNALKGSPGHHRFLRHQLGDGLGAPFPVLLAVGNHDLAPDRFGLDDFRRDYGPTNFSFTCRESLFVVLQAVDPPWDNAATVRFLEDLVAGTDRATFRHVFALMHIAPYATPNHYGRDYAEKDRIRELLRELGADYIIAADFHGYARSELPGTHLIVTGGGGARLAERVHPQFHHALVVTVTPDGVHERLVASAHVDDWRERVVKMAVADAWPWIDAHATLALVLATLLAGTGPVALWWLWRRPQPPVAVSTGD